MQKSRSGLFLLELIFAIFIFSLCSVICLQLFVRARSLSDQTQLETKAVSLCKDVAELFYGYDGNLSKVIHELNTKNYAIMDASSAGFYYDSDFKETSKSSAEYVLTISTQNDDATSVILATITFIRLKDFSTIYELNLKHFPGKVSDTDGLSNVSAGTVDGVYSGVPMGDSSTPPTQENADSGVLDENALDSGVLDENALDSGVPEEENTTLKVGEGGVL